MTNDTLWNSQAQVIVEAFYTAHLLIRDGGETWGSSHQWDDCKKANEANERTT